MMRWIEDRFSLLEKEDLSGFIFKSRSPSSAIRGVKVFSAEGLECGHGPGVFGGAFIKRFPLIPAIDDEELGDPVLRSNFLRSVFSHGGSKDPKKHE